MDAQITLFCAPDDAVVVAGQSLLITANGSPTGDSCPVRGDDCPMFRDGRPARRDDLIMLAPFFLICLGQALAVGVHAGTWWLRARNLSLAAMFGAFVFAMAAFAWFLFWFSDGPDDVAARASAAAAMAAQDRVNSLIFTAIFCGIFGALGLYHCVLLKRRLSWLNWTGTTLAVWFEMGVAFLVGSQLSVASESLVRTGDAALWPSAFFALTLLALTLFRPLALRIAREVPALLQSTRRVARF